MKALTLTQPWATLVAIGAKTIETRSWSTSYRGPVAIHAAKGFPKWARAFTMEPVCYEAVRYANQRPADLLAAYPLGVVLATARLVNVLPTEKINGISAQEEAFGDYSPCRFAWFLEDVKELDKPVPAKGALGLWEWT